MSETAFGTAIAGSADGEALLAERPGLIDLLPIAIYACDATGKVAWFNRRAVELWGREPAPGEDAERFYGPFKVYNLEGELIRRDETPMAQVLRTGVPAPGREAPVERPDGSRLVTMAHIDPIFDAAGQIVGAINCFHDVTEVKREDRELRERERQFRDLLDALPAAIYTTDEAGRITYFNEAAVELSGRRPKLGVDAWCVTWKLFWPDGTSLAHDECPMAIALKDDVAVRGYEAIAERPDGTRVPFIPYPTPLHDAAGKVIGAVNMLVDISHRKQAESQQRVMFAELNHRIKNNMQMLHGLLRAAERESRTPEARVELAGAVRRVSAMAAAQQALYVAEKATVFSGPAFLASVCDSARQAFGPRVVLDCRADACELSNDTAVPLALIVNELVVNAAKYGADEDGAAWIRVALGKAGEVFTLTVEDSGPGFDLTQARKRASGLGLVSGLARQIGGALSVERAPGARCTVRFRDAHKAD